VNKWERFLPLGMLLAAVGPCSGLAVLSVGYRLATGHWYVAKPSRFDRPKSTLEQFRQGVLSHWVKNPEGK
jgi:hypothetical protein